LGGCVRMVGLGFWKGNFMKECKYKEKVLTYYICAKYEISDVDCCGCEYMQLLKLENENKKLRDIIKNISINKVRQQKQIEAITDENEILKVKLRIWAGGKNEKTY